MTDARDPAVTPEPSDPAVTPESSDPAAARASRSLTAASLERRRRFDIHPNRELGQNFLVDDNVLGVIGRAAELAPADTVLEIGGGLGVLSEYLARHVAHVHVVETDRRLVPVLEEALSPYENAGVVAGDVMDVDLRILEPAPDKVVANLPYGVAVPAIVRTIDELEGVGLWCVMVQREIADRLRARPGIKAYGVPSVIVQLACDVKLVRPISRNVFQPAPNVDSALLVMRRTGAAPPRAVRDLVQLAFAHRRKALGGSLELGVEARQGRDAGRQARGAARTALERMGHPADERAERLAPAEFVTLARELEQWLR